MSRKRGRWELADLATFSRGYVQVYALLYCLQPDGNELDAVQTAMVRRLSRTFPWRGGWSAVDFYDSRRNVAPRSHAPGIRSMQYASPGWMDLAMVVQVGAMAAMIITAIAKGIEKAEAIYHNIYKHAQERKLLKLDVRRQSSLRRP